LYSKSKLALSCRSTANGRQCNKTYSFFSDNFTQIYTIIVGTLFYKCLVIGQNQFNLKD